MQSTGDIPSSSPDPVQIGQGREINMHLDRIFANDLTPISRLPVEIMCKILLLVRMSSIGLNGNPPGQDLLWIQAVSHVCSQWRHISLESAALWTYLPLASPQWMTIMLERSKAAGLTVEADLIEDETKVFFQGVQLKLGFRRALENGPRIGHLLFRGDRFSWDEVADSFSTTFPRLESLRLSIEYTSDHPFLPDGLLADARMLRRLELSKFTVNMTSNILHTIRHLKLHNIEYSSELTLSEFINHLGQLDVLESLDLKDAFPTHRHIQVEVPFFNRTHFPHLRELIITCNNIDMEAETFFDVGAFFLHIAFPTSTRVQLSSQCTLEDISGTLSSIAQSYSNSISDLELRTLVVQEPVLSERDLVVLAAASRAGIQLRLFEETTGDRPLEFDSFPEAEYLNLSFVWEEDHTTQETSGLQGNKVMSSFFKSKFPLEDIEHVHLADMVIDAETLKSTVGLLPYVSYISTNGPIGNRLIDALKLHGRDIVADSEEFTNNIHFESLSCIGFGELSLPCPYNHPRDPNDINLEDLTCVLTQRSRKGFALQSLDLRNCIGQVGWEHMDKLQEAVWGIYLPEDMHQRECNACQEEEEEAYKDQDSFVDRDFLLACFGFV